MNCLDCYPKETPAIATCGHCGAGLCAQHLVESDEHLTFTMPIAVQVRAARPARKLRCRRCAAAEADQRDHKAA